MNIKNNQYGFTLIELLTAIVITGLVVSLSFGIHNRISRIIKVKEEQAVLIKGANYIFEKVKSEIRGAERIISASLDKIEILKRNGKIGEFSFEDGIIRYNGQDIDIDEKVTIEKFEFEFGGEDDNLDSDLDGVLNVFEMDLDGDGVLDIRESDKIKTITIAFAAMVKEYRYELRTTVFKR